MDKEIRLESERRGLLIYFLITVFAPLLLGELFLFLVKGGYLPLSDSVGTTVCSIVMGIPLLVLGYFLIFLKNHEITVSGTTVTNFVRPLNRTSSFTLCEVKSVKRGFLGEIVLKNEDGRTFLTVEKGMTNYEMFIDYLRKNNFKEI